jgi:PIN domain nuclease of toxin-antitoxin system
MADESGPLVADTHTFAWYVKASPQLSGRARKVLQEATMKMFPIFVSTASMVELRYLVEKGTLTEEHFDAMLAALLTPASTFEIMPFNGVMAQTVTEIPRDPVADPFDRMIAATAVALGVPLVTRDRKLRALPAVKTVW